MAKLNEIVMQNYLLVLITLLAVSCNQLFGERGNGNRITEIVAVADFERLEIAGGFEVMLSSTTTGNITIEVDENLLRYIKVGVNEGTLTVDTDRRLDSEDGVKLIIPVNNLSVLTSSGASEIKSDGPIRSESLVIELSGAGRLELILESKTVSVDLSGASMVQLEGLAQMLSVDMSGAGSLDASKLITEVCTVQISGVGKALVHATESLEASVSGLGKVEYLGDPKSVKGDVSGVGDVSKLD